MTIRVERDKNADKLAVGGALSPEQMQVLESVAVSSDDILKNMDALNAEIKESHSDFLAVAPEEENIDDALDSLMQEIKSTPPKESPVAEPEVNPEEALKDRLLDLLKKIPDSPSEAQIAAWKRQYGENAVNVLALGEEDVYIYTHLRRGQWQKIQSIIQEMQGREVQGVEEKLKEKVVQYCVLWPRPLPIEFFVNSRAGVLEAIYNAIMMDSYFLQPQQIVMLTTRL